jgi:outer membrane lipoprotein-sorting protein/mono/diheme cytochrome c family protein
MLTKVLLAGSVLLLGFAVQQNHFPAPLAKNYEKLGSTDGLTVKFRYRIFGKPDEEYLLVAQKPDKFRLSYPGGFVQSDGKTYYVYTVSTNTFTREPMTPEILNAFANRPELLAWGDFFKKEMGANIVVAKIGESRTMVAPTFKPKSLEDDMEQVALGKALDVASATEGLSEDRSIQDVNILFKDGGGTSTFFLDKDLGLARGFSLKKADKDYLAMASLVSLSVYKFGATKFAFVPPQGAMTYSTDEPDATFAKVQEIMDNSCAPCHTTNSAGDVNVSTYQGVLGIVKPGNASSSELVRVLRATGRQRMPRNSAPLLESQIRLIEKWINKGAEG